MYLDRDTKCLFVSPGVVDVRCASPVANERLVSYARRDSKQNC